jgi:2-polyprenyl-6-methoxyphenol hydroxylase-like FAD-dependent oxidoreductase
MKVTIVGAGPAGLSTAILIKQKIDAEVIVLEGGPEGDAPGLGIALLPFGLGELQQLGIPGFDGFAAQCVAIGRETEAFAGTDEVGVTITRQSRTQPTQYWGVKRATLLDFLRRGAASSGVAIKYDCDVSEDRVRKEAATADLLVGADGAGSIVRQTFADELSPVAEPATSRFAWLELAGHLEKFMFGYVPVPGEGLVRITAYPHGPEAGSAIITHSGRMSDYFGRTDMLEDSGEMSNLALGRLNALFGRGLGGIPIVGSSRWRSFRATHCARAAFDNVAVVGDAFVTVFYETGWGTSTALQEARILRQTLVVKNSVHEALELYNRKALEICDGLITACLRTMREVDAQGAKMEQLGAAAFLKSFPA